MESCPFPPPRNRSGIKRAEQKAGLRRLGLEGEKSKCARAALIARSPLPHPEGGGGSGGGDMEEGWRSRGVAGQRKRSGAVAQAPWKRPPPRRLAKQSRSGRRVPAQQTRGEILCSKCKLCTERERYNRPPPQPHRRRAPPAPALLRQPSLPPSLSLPPPPRFGSPAPPDSFPRPPLQAAAASLRPDAPSDSPRPTRLLPLRGPPRSSGPAGTPAPTLGENSNPQVFNPGRSRMEPWLSPPPLPSAPLPGPLRGLALTQ